MVSFFEIEMLGNLSDQYSRMAHVKEVLIDENLVSESEG